MSVGVNSWQRGRCASSTCRAVVPSRHAAAAGRLSACHSPSDNNRLAYSRPNTINGTRQMHTFY